MTCIGGLAIQTTMFGRAYDAGYMEFTRLLRACFAALKYDVQLWPTTSNCLYFNFQSKVETPEEQDFKHLVNQIFEVFEDCNYDYDHAMLNLQTLGVLPVPNAFIDT